MNTKIENYTVNVTCERCATLFQWETEYHPTDVWHRMMKPSHCATCEPIIFAEREEAHRIATAERLKGIVNRFVSQIIVPPLFEKTDTDHPRFNQAGWAKVKAWRPTDEKPWLGLIGETGTSKSRIAYLLTLDIAREIATEHFTNDPDSWNNGFGQSLKVIITSAYEITDACMAQFSNDKEVSEDARMFLKQLRRCALVMLDDVGKGRITPAVAAELFAIADHRYKNQLPTVWTANSTPEEIAGVMSQDMAGPFAGRFNDSSRIIRLK